MKHEIYIYNRPDLLSGVACLAFLPEPGATLGDGAGLFFCSTFLSLKYRLGITNLITTPSQVRKKLGTITERSKI